MDLEKSSDLVASRAQIAENLAQTADIVQEEPLNTEKKNSNKNKLRVSIKPTDEVEDRLDLEGNKEKNGLVDSVVDTRAAPLPTVSQSKSAFHIQNKFNTLNHFF